MMDIMKSESWISGRLYSSRLIHVSSGMAAVNLMGVVCGFTK
jgi:hypothetical protein